ncbi:MAG: GPW/gp25 family protein [Saprospiraceae bacterium]|nr:GPW/gp25 family protein [Saprospiraceae bacterium]
MFHLKSTLSFNNLGRTSGTDYDNHINDMVQHILFTTPGERVNRPDFGSGLYQAVFEPNSSEVAATLQFLLHGALNQWLSGIIEINDVNVNANDAVLEVKVVYTIIRNREQRVANFSQPLP